MKELRFFVFSGMLVGILILAGCGGDDGPKKTDEEKQLEALAADWTMGSATLDGADASSNFSGLVVSFTEESTFSTNGDYAPVWPSTGTFSFGSDLNTLVRNDGVSMSIVLDGSSLTVSFTYGGDGARLEGLPGAYVFQFSAP